MNAGRAAYNSGEASGAVRSFTEAVGLDPVSPDARLNLANAYLLANQPAPAVEQAQEAQRLQPGNAAGYYLEGCGLLRQGSFSNAVQALSIAKQIDRTINPVSLQLGMAYLGWGKIPEAVTELEEVVEFEKDHPTAHYQLSQAYLRQGRRDDAQRELTEHQRVSAGKPQIATDPHKFELCKYTEIHIPIVVTQPDTRGIPVQFVNATSTAFPAGTTAFIGPVGIFDIDQRGWNDLLAVDGQGGLALLWNSNGVFAPRGPSIPSGVGKIASILVGDLQNDHFEDAIILGENGAQVLRFATNGNAFDATAISGLRNLKSKSGVLVDIDFIGKLGLLAADSSDGTLRTFSALASMGTMSSTPAVFREKKPTTNAVPAPKGVSQIVIDDWDNDDLMDAVLVREGQPPLLLLNRRGQGLQTATNAPTWPVSKRVAMGDLDNDLRTDIVFLTADSLEIRLSGQKEPQRINVKDDRLTHCRLLDYDNDGWLDLVAWGERGLHCWRNRGTQGFVETTQELGFSTLSNSVSEIAAADFDQDGDIDLVIDLGPAGLQFWRNNAANVNGLLKLRPIGNRSNASGLGLRVEVNSGNWQTIRTVGSLPLEIGVGKRTKVDNIISRWFDNQLADTEVVVTPAAAHPLLEIVTQNTGSCPYLYAWDGKQFRFVTDILSAAPLGLPAFEGVYIQDDPDEFVRLGDEAGLPLKDGKLVLQVTEELREALYLDFARLVAVDHPPGLDVQSTSKLLPHPPFARHGIQALTHRVALQKATRLDGTDVTGKLAAIDGQRVAAPVLRGPQMRGNAVPHGYILDFGSLDVSKHWVLALTGWLRFGGGMGNMAASHDPEAPYPFPVLESSVNGTQWQKVPVEVGTPAGKTKTILTDLQGQLPVGTRYLRLTEAFDLYWDCAELWEAADSTSFKQLVAEPTSTHLHWRGYSPNADLPFEEPLTPDYQRVQQKPWWKITPTGWATRYGEVSELVKDKDSGVAIITGGDELTLSFDPGGLPAKPEGWTRTYFFWSVGWDKDSDYHVATGDRIDPLPWHGLDAQAYGKQPRPELPSDSLHTRYNTRWVGPLTLAREIDRRGVK
ncbi:MAG TPA: FG-GAP-like repeat-containing protein [Candidatus Limnocylindria bacterium]|jgi:Flp pilus assembly protein TadD|nr:FG-GAP-like repeat-containing protein [Candidatus Limnocylindria bacterium]